MDFSGEPLYLVIQTAPTARGFRFHRVPIASLEAPARMQSFDLAHRVLTARGSPRLAPIFGPR